MSQAATTISLALLMFSGPTLLDSHSIYHQSFPTPKGFHHGKSDSYMDRLRWLRKNKRDSNGNLNTYGDRFLEQYNKMMNTSNGYFSSGGVPYHSIELLMCEAPDYGHETTSEAYSFYIWLTAEYGWYSGDFTDFKTAWSSLENTIIPGNDNQPSSSIEQYNPESPATYAAEEDSPDDYPVALDSSVSVGVDPLNDELAAVYGSSDTTLDQFYATHWLVDVDNIYGFGDQESGNKQDTNVFINTFQRGPNESVWRTIPQPEWEDLKYGDTECGFQDLFTKDPNGCKAQWRYTGAPDADARTIQATYWALNWAGSDTDLSDIAGKATKLGDFLRYSLWDKYFKTIPCHDPSCPATTWDDSWNSTFYLISWYYAWGGNIGSYDWSWRIGASHVHQGYQNVMTAYALSNFADLESKTTAGKDHWGGVMDRTLDFWQWLQSTDGPIAGGATNSWKGRYADPTEDGITGYFNGLAYDWQPVYHCPPSNNWFGMQVWSMERLAEYYYSTSDSRAETILENWIKWFDTELVDNIFLSGNDWQVPSNLQWSGQPDTWTGSWTGNSNLRASVTDYSKDVGTGSALVQILSYYSAAKSDSTYQEYAAELLDRMYLYADDAGIGCEEERQDYVGDEYGNGFWEPVYVPSDYTGTYPDGDTIKSGVNFTDIRLWYKSVDGFSYVEQCKESNSVPTFTYHRFWSQASYAIACADYSRLFESSTGRRRQ